MIMLVSFGIFLQAPSTSCRWMSSWHPAHRYKSSPFLFLSTWATIFAKCFLHPSHLRLFIFFWNTLIGYSLLRLISISESYSLTSLNTTMWSHPLKCLHTYGLPISTLRFLSRVVSMLKQLQSTLLTLATLMISFDMSSLPSRESLQKLLLMKKKLPFFGFLGYNSSIKQQKRSLSSERRTPPWHMNQFCFSLLQLSQKMTWTMTSLGLRVFFPLIYIDLRCYRKSDLRTLVSGLLVLSSLILVTQDTRLFSARALLRRALGLKGLTLERRQYEATASSLVFSMFDLKAFTSSQSPLQCSTAFLFCWMDLLSLSRRVSSSSEGILARTSSMVGMRASLSMSSMSQAQRGMPSMASFRLCLQANSSCCICSMVPTPF